MTLRDVSAKSLHMFSHSSLSITGPQGRAAPGTEQNVILTSGGSRDSPLRTQPENDLHRTQGLFLG